MDFNFIYDSEEEKYVNEIVLPLINDIISSATVYNKQSHSEILVGSNVLLFLSDIQVKEILPILQEKEVTIAMLPHPGANRFCRTTGVESKLEKALTHLRSNPKIIEIDILHCNGCPVFTSVVIGESFQLATSNFFRSINFWNKIKSLFSLFFLMYPFQLELAKKNEKKIKTAVSGAVVTTHKNNSELSRYIPDKSHINDGMLYALLICPRSVLELLTWAFKSLWQKNILPDFGAYIKTDKIHLAGSNRKKLLYTIDGVSRESLEIDFEVQKKAIKIFTGSRLEIPENSPSGNEVFKTQTLPSAEAALELSQHKLPFIRRASTEEFKDLFSILRDNAQLKRSYLVLMILSTSLATLGLFTNSSPVIIGAMILAPLMSPIISLSMAALRQDRELMVKSFYTILGGIGISFFFAVLLTWITPINSPNQEIISRTNPNLVDLGIAVLSGIAGAYAYAREEVAKTLAGVAIAVALVPPLAVAGIGIGWMDWQVFSGAILLLFTNLAGMVLAGSITFMVLGFSPFRLATKGIFVSLLVVIIFSIPLGLSFQQMIFKHNVVNTLDGWETENMTLRDVSLISSKPLNISFTLVSEKQINDEKIEELKTKIEARLQQKVELQISIAMKR